jgi:hypothetical protein
MAKPRAIDLLEKFVQAEHRLGKSQDSIARDMTEAVNFFIDSEVSPDLNSIERQALNKLGAPIVDKAVAKYVNEILSS